jgi:hypothetical protein
LQGVVGVARKKSRAVQVVVDGGCVGKVFEGDGSAQRGPCFVFGRIGFNDLPMREEGRVGQVPVSVVRVVEINVVVKVVLIVVLL